MISGKSYLYIVFKPHLDTQKLKQKIINRAVFFQTRDDFWITGPNLKNICNRSDQLPKCFVVNLQQPDVPPRKTVYSVSEFNITD